jgi:hypothetical protein
MTQQTFWDLPQAPNNDTDPSKQAARRIVRSSDTQKNLAALLVFIQNTGKFGATDQEIGAHFGWQGDYTRPRRLTLLKEGKIKIRTRNAEKWYREIGGQKFTVYVTI